MRNHPPAREPAWLVINDKGQFWSGAGWVSGFSDAKMWRLKDSTRGEVDEACDLAERLTGQTAHLVLFSVGAQHPCLRATRSKKTS